MTEALESLFEAVRAACSTLTWSRGVELTRVDAVVAEGDISDTDEVVFRVSTRGGIISPTVTLYPDDAEWDCQCPSRDEACEHVAAAVIAWRRARSEQRPLQSAEQAGRVEYHFRREGTALTLERAITRNEETCPLETTLATAATGVTGMPPFVAAQADLAAELALGTHRRGTLPRHLVPRLFARLAESKAVFLDGRNVRLSASPVLPRARLVDQEPGFRLYLEEDDSVGEAFANGIALCGDTLRPLAEPRLTGRELHELPRGRYFGLDDVALLVTEVLPDLRKRIPVEVSTKRLPETARERPRIQIDTRRDGHTLSVIATLVYGAPPTARIDGGRFVHLQGPVPVRDEAAERRAVRSLERVLGLAPGVREELVGEAAVAFCSRLESWEGAVSGRRAREHFRLVGPLTPSVRVQGTGLEIDFEVQDGSSGPGRSGAGRADPAAVLRAWREGESLVPLLEGGWAPLPTDWLQKFGHRVADLLAARGEDGEIPRCCLDDLAELCEKLDQPPPPELEGLRRLHETFEGLSHVAAPADLTASLRDYQQRGVDWLAFLREAGVGGLLADDMGLGKTLQALCAVRRRALVVSPTSVLHNWADEIRRHRPGLSCSVYHGPGRSLDRTVDVTLTTYAILRLDADRLAGESWDSVVLDEAQAIKNPESQVAAAAYRLRAPFKITLTGTPVENRLEELWSQFHFINRGLLGGRRDFQERYAGPIASGEAAAAAHLRERIRPFVLRRLKQEVAPELPPRTEVVLRCELSSAEREVYDVVRTAALGEVVQRLEAGGNVLAALEVLLRLRQASCHPALVPGQEAAGSSKLTLLLETLDNVVAEGHKALVFSQWTSLLDLVEPHLEQAGIPFGRLDGSTRDRAGVVREFQDEGGPPVLLISLKAGGTGLNLTAADHVFLLDPWWNPAVEDQAADRAHRIGQDRPVMIYRLVAEETVEERILSLQERKRALADAALGEAGRAVSLTRDDLLDLLR